MKEEKFLEASKIRNEIIVLEQLISKDEKTIDFKRLSYSTLSEKMQDKLFNLFEQHINELKEKFNKL